MVKIFLLVFLCLSFAETSIAQTGPAPLAEKTSVADTVVTRPKQLYDSEAAAAIWKLNVRNGETTAAMIKRARKMLNELLAKNPDKLNYDSDYWRLLAYLREVPWSKMPESRRSWYLKKMPNPRITDEQRSKWLELLDKKPLFKMTPKELDVYLAAMQEREPDLRNRVVSLARKNLGQPYDIYLLGEFPHEVYDPDPMFNLGEGDCVVFSEHIYAMALSHDWKTFYSTLQKLRYKDGVPGMTTRNHFTEADWNKNNAWLIQDVTNEIGATTVTQYREKIDRARFFKNFGIGQDFPVEMLEDTYIPAEAIESVLGELKDGDFVNIVRGVGEGVWVGHVGMIGHNKKGDVTFIHSTEPKSKEQPIMEYVNDNLKANKRRAARGTAEFKGMKFLRLKADELSATYRSEAASQ